MGSRAILALFSNFSWIAKEAKQGSQNGICPCKHDEESVTEHQEARISLFGCQNGLLVHAQADSAVCSGCSGRAQECSPSAQVRAAATHVQTLKRNQQKKKLSLTYVVAWHFSIDPQYVGASQFAIHVCQVSDLTPTLMKSLDLELSVEYKLVSILPLRSSAPPSA